MVVSKRGIAFTCLLSFALGGGAGWWAGRDLFPRHWNREQKYKEMLERFNSQLKLTPAQRDQIKALLDANRQKLEAMREERREEFRRFTREEIRTLLTPEQQKKFDRMELEWQARRLNRER